MSSCATSCTSKVSHATKSHRGLYVASSIFLLFVAAIYVVYLNFPKLEEGEKEHMKLPRNIEDAKLLATVLSRYTDRYFKQVLAAIFVFFIFLQTFAIPGSIFLSVLSGFLFSFPLALFLVCFSSAVGASLCYVVTYFVGKVYIERFFPARITSLGKTVAKHRHHLFYYLLFLRMTPILPNWLINISSPVLDVPLNTFFWATFVGVAGPSFVSIRAGTTLFQLTSTGDAFPWTSAAILVGLGFLSLLPVFFKKRLSKRL